MSRYQELAPRLERNYNRPMGIYLRKRGQKHLVHWVVLWALLLGQLALGLGYGIAAQRADGAIKIPVCTSSGIEYTSWSSDGSSGERSSSAKSGGCVFCSVSPVYFDFDDTPKVAPATDLGSVQFIYHSVFLPHQRLTALTGAPRAPPSC